MEQNLNQNISIVNKLRQQIAEKYEQQCVKVKHNANKSVIRVFLDPVSTPKLDLVFRGNDKLNFTSRLADQDLIIICGCVNEIKGCRDYVRNIDFSYNLLTDISIGELSGLIEKCQNIESLNLQGNDIAIQGAQSLSKVLKNNNSLCYLNLGYNKIKTDGAMRIVEILFTNKNLIELNLANNEINHDGIIGITSVLNWNNDTLQILNLDKPTYTSIGQETIIHFAKMLQSNKSIQKLSLKKHDFTCDGIYTLTENLLENTTLRVLDLTANKISFQGCESLAKYLMGEYCSLRSLILASNKCGHYGAKAIANAIANNQTLIHLDMTRNDIDDNGLKMIAEALKENNTLVSVKLYWNHFGQSALEAFDQVRKIQRKNDWFFDFTTYYLDDHYEIAYIDTAIDYDINVSTNYYYSGDE